MAAAMTIAAPSPLRAHQLKGGENFAYDFGGRRCPARRARTTRGGLLILRVVVSMLVTFDSG